MKLNIMLNNKTSYIKSVQELEQLAGTDYIRSMSQYF